MSVRSAYYPVQRGSTKYKVLGSNLMNRDTGILQDGDVFLAYRRDRYYQYTPRKFTVSLDGGGGVDLSTIRDEDLFVCNYNGIDYKVTAPQFRGLFEYTVYNVWNYKNGLPEALWWTEFVLNNIGDDIGLPTGTPNAGTTCQMVSPSVGSPMPVESIHKQVSGIGGPTTWKIKMPQGRTYEDDVVSGATVVFDIK